MTRPPDQPPYGQQPYGQWEQRPDGGPGSWPGHYAQDPWHDDGQQPGYDGYPPLPSPPQTPEGYPPLPLPGGHQPSPQFPSTQPTPLPGTGQEPPPPWAYGGTERGEQTRLEMLPLPGEQYQNVGPPSGVYPAPSSGDPELPKPAVTFWTSVFLLPLGLIPASRHSRTAEERGASGSPYWKSFGGGIIAGLAFWSLLVFAWLALVVGIFNKDEAKADKSNPAPQTSQSQGADPSDKSSGKSGDKSGSNKSSGTNSSSGAPSSSAPPTTTSTPPAPNPPTDSPTKGQTVTVTTVGDVHLRQLPDKTSADLGVLPAGTTVTGLDVGGWLEINQNGQRAYVSLAGARGEKN